MATCVSKHAQRETDEKTRVNDKIETNEDPIQNETEVVGIMGEVNVTDVLKAAEYCTRLLIYRRLSKINANI